MDAADIPTASPTDPAIDATIGCAMSAVAAVAWYDRTVNRGTAFKRLAAAMAWVSRAKQPATTTFRKPSEFLALLRQPVNRWLAVDSEAALLDGNVPTTYCLDLVTESGPEPLAEHVQGKVGAARATFARRREGLIEYTRFRRFLIEHPYTTVSDAIRGLGGSGLALGDLYEEIPSLCRLESGGREHFYPCPRCRWPMWFNDMMLECTAPVCAAAGARFRCGDDWRPEISLRSAPLPTAVPVEDHVRLQRPVWRYTLLPGLVELELARRLRAIRRVHVDLWPDLDAYDLRVAVGSQVWKVDVKDWSNPISLARHLQEALRDPQVLIVVPDERADQLAVLRERAACAPLSIQTASGFVRLVRQHCKSRGGRK